MPNKREDELRRLISREYKLYKAEEVQKSVRRGLYEKTCNAAEKILKVSPGKKDRKKLQEAIDFAHINITPEGAMSLTFLFLLLFMFPTIILIAMKYVGLPGLTLGYGSMVIGMCIFFMYYLYTYPFQLKRKYEASIGSEIVTMILYMIMYMRNTPSLEGAVRFAAENIGGDLGYELKKLLWDVEVRNYLSMEDALLDYSKKWAGNRPFIESLQLIMSSLRQVGEKRTGVLDESVNVVLEGTREQAKNFNQKLKMPITIVNALGIILPVMGLVLFPIVAVFLHVEATILFVGYDVVLPFILYFVITGILETRPATFSKIDISANPDVPPLGKFKWGNKFVKAWPFGLLVGIIVLSLGIVLYLNELAAAAAAGEEFEGIIPAVIITAGFSFGFAVYYILASNPFLKLRSQTRQIEGEFAEALYQLGTNVSGGVPIELSMQSSMARIKDLKIKDMFQTAIKNMKLYGMTFSQAFFDPKTGAVNYYPSKLVKSVMKTVVESSKKGVRTAAVTMISVSNYLKGVHKTQEDVNDSLSETLNSLKFQAFFLTPLISGIIGTMAIVIIRILAQLGKSSQGLGGPEGIPMLTTFGEISISPFQFILIVSIYMIESSFILAMFINSIESGEDVVGKQNLTGYTLLISTIVFIVALMATLTIFGPLVSEVA